jgi:hypothetical protein
LPIGRLFSLASLLKIVDVAQILRLRALMLIKICFATFWATFSRAHLVTLVPARPGTVVVILKIFSPKNRQKNGVFDSKES